MKGECKDYLNNDVFCTKLRTVLTTRLSLCHVNEVVVGRGWGAREDEGGNKENFYYLFCYTDLNPWNSSLKYQQLN